MRKKESPPEIQVGDLVANSWNGELGVVTEIIHMNNRFDATRRHAIYVTYTADGEATNLPDNVPELMSRPDGP